MNKITLTINDLLYNRREKTLKEREESLKELTSVIFSEVFNICWKYTDNETLFLIMKDVDKIKEENQLPI